MQDGEAVTYMPSYLPVVYAANASYCSCCSALSSERLRRPSLSVIMGGRCVVRVDVEWLHSHKDG